MPPTPHCRVSRKDGGPVNIQDNEEVVPLGLKILKEHLMAWNLGGRILEAPVVATWWVLYDYHAIMAYGHTVNTDIPEDVNEAEFPPEPWPERVIIRIKSQAPPQIPAAPLPAGDGSQEPPSAPGSPSGWKGVALGQAQPISADASGLVGYHSQYDGANVPEGIEEEIPPDPELLRLRGEAKRDKEVHSLISWTTRKSYPTLIGVSLPIQDPVGGEFHEGQLWEEVTEDLIIQGKHAQIMYEWLMGRLKVRSSENMLPEGMPETVEDVTVQVMKDRKAGYILFTPNDSLAVPLKKMNIQAIIKYEGGYNILLHSCIAISGARVSLCSGFGSALLRDRVSSAYSFPGPAVSAPVGPLVAMVVELDGPVVWLPN
jgi:hypothetical protein